jgi:hypothetical protein
MTRPAMSEAALIAAGTLLHASIAALLFLYAGPDVEATQLALRTTARMSFVWFMLAFVASPLAQLAPGPASAWLLRRRRAFGVIFGLSMTMHGGSSCVCSCCTRPSGRRWSPTPTSTWASRGSFWWRR